MSKRNSQKSRASSSAKTRTTSKSVKKTVKSSEVLLQDDESDFDPADSQTTSQKTRSSAKGTSAKKSLAKRATTAKKRMCSSQKTSSELAKEKVISALKQSVDEDEEMGTPIMQSSESDVSLQDSSDDYQSSSAAKKKKKPKKGALKREATKSKKSGKELKCLETASLAYEITPLAQAKVNLFEAKYLAPIITDGSIYGSGMNAFINLLLQSVCQEDSESSLGGGWADFENLDFRLLLISLIRKGSRSHDETVQRFVDNGGLKVILNWFISSSPPITLFSKELKQHIKKHGSESADNSKIVLTTGEKVFGKILQAALSDAPTPSSAMQESSQMTDTSIKEGSFGNIVEHIEILGQLLELVNELPISVDILQKVPIGKTVNRFTKSIKSALNQFAKVKTESGSSCPGTFRIIKEAEAKFSEMFELAESVVAKWKQMVKVYSDSMKDDFEQNIKQLQDQQQQQISNLEPPSEECETAATQNTSFSGLAAAHQKACQSASIQPCPEFKQRTRLLQLMNSAINRKEQEQTAGNRPEKKDCVLKQITSQEQKPPHSIFDEAPSGFVKKEAGIGSFAGVGPSSALDPSFGQQNSEDLAVLLGQTYSNSSSQFEFKNDLKQQKINLQGLQQSFLNKFSQQQKELRETSISNDEKLNAFQQLQETFKASKAALRSHQNLHQMEPRIRISSWPIQISPILKGSFKVKRTDYKRVGDKGVEKDTQIARERQKHHIKQADDPAKQNLGYISEFDAFKQKGSSIVELDLEEFSESVKEKEFDPEQQGPLLRKLTQIIKSDSESIYNNKEIFLKILENLSKEVLDYIFKIPSPEDQQSAQESQNPFLKAKAETQQQIYNLMTSHYLQNVGQESTQNLINSGMCNELIYRKTKAFFFNGNSQLEKAIIGEQLSDLMKLYSQVVKNKEIRQPEANRSAQVQAKLQLMQQHIQKQRQHQLPSLQEVHYSKEQATHSEQAPAQDEEEEAAQSPKLTDQQKAFLEYTAQQQAAAMGMPWARCGFSQQQAAAMAMAMSQSMPQSMMMSMFDKDMPFKTTPGNSQRTTIKNYKTVPCRMYHSPAALQDSSGKGGCNRGDNCHFIHEPAFIGMDIPRPALLQIRERNKRLLDSQGFTSPIRDGTGMTQEDFKTENPLTLDEFDSSGISSAGFPTPTQVSRGASLSQSTEYLNQLEQLSCLKPKNQDKNQIKMSSLQTLSLMSQQWGNMMASTDPRTALTQLNELTLLQQQQNQLSMLTSQSIDGLTRVQQTQILQRQRAWQLWLIQQLKNFVTKNQSNYFGASKEDGGEDNPASLQIKSIINQQQQQQIISMEQIMQKFQQVQNEADFSRGADTRGEVQVVDKAGKQLAEEDVPWSKIQIKTERKEETPRATSPAQKSRSRSLSRDRRKSKDRASSPSGSPEPRHYQGRHGGRKRSYTPVKGDSFKSRNAIRRSRERRKRRDFPSISFPPLDEPRKPEATSNKDLYNRTRQKYIAHSLQMNQPQGGTTTSLSAVIGTGGSRNFDPKQPRSYRDKIQGERKRPGRRSSMSSDDGFYDPKRAKHSPSHVGKKRERRYNEDRGHKRRRR